MDATAQQAWQQLFIIIMAGPLEAGEGESEVY